MARLFLVEDNPDLAFGLRANLELEGHKVVICTDGNLALSALEEESPELIILDVMLPGRDGFAILADIRKAGIVTPVLMLTARGEETDKVFALRRGADDYVTKPFGLLELLARIEALLRRSRNAGKPETRDYKFGTIRINPPTRQVWLAEQQVSLTPKEYDLLLALADAPNQVLSRQSLLRQVWGHQSEVESRTVDTHMAELRRKLEQNPARPRYLLTARGAGYWLRIRA